jgi:hypothetical protein
MPRLSKPRISDEEAYQQALAEADAEMKEAMTVSLEGTTFQRKLARPTLVGHERTKHLWRLFVQSHPTQSKTLPTEIVQGVNLPDQGTLHHSVYYGCC